MPKAEQGEDPRTGTPAKPEYSKSPQSDSGATQFWIIRVDEGWRSWILCTDMYDWAADQLLEILRSAKHEWRQ